MTCTFFGHSDTPAAAEGVLRQTLVDLIENKKADLFYVGNHGNFDRLVRRTLKNLSVIYPHIRYRVVLAYMPQKPRKDDPGDFSDTVYPDAIARCPPKYAIIRRNNWMLEKSDCVITYVVRDAGGAAHFKHAAEHKHKLVINLAL